MSQDNTSPAGHVSAAPAPGLRKRRAIPTSRKVLYSLVILVLFFGGAELLARFLGGPSLHGTPPVGNRKFVTWLSALSADDAQDAELYREDPLLLWRLVPSTQVDTSNHHHAPGAEKQPVRITINSDGYRGRKIDAGKDRATFRVLCLGDSNFFGYPLDDQYAFPQALENALARDKPARAVEVINGGVPGYTVVQGKQWFLERFAQHRFDVLLLSFLNNDAWPQPQTDAQLIERYASTAHAVSGLLQHSRLAGWLGARLVPAVPPAEFVPRVPREQYVRDYAFLIETAQAARAKVVIVDHRAYPEYEAYSRELRGLAQRHGADYVAVAEQVAERLKNLRTLEQYPAAAERAKRRWGALLQERPYLWYYAEYYPEHLNELGSLWLADRVAPLVRARLEETPAGTEPKQ